MAKFIVFEGIDGSGKSTLSKQLYEKLLLEGYRVWLTTEPYNQHIKELVSQTKDEVDRALLFAIDRNNHVDKIKEELMNYDFIISDRYVDSSLTYQYILSDWVTNGWLKKINKKGIDFEPDLIFYLDIPVKLSLERMKNRRDNDQLDSILNEESLKLIKKEYNKLYKYNKNVINVDINNQNIDFLFKEVIERFE